MSSLRCSGGQEDKTENHEQESPVAKRNRGVESTENATNLVARGRRTRPREKELVVLVGHFYEIEHWRNCSSRTNIYEVVGEVASVYRKHQSRLSASLSPLSMVLRDKNRRNTLKVLFTADCEPLENLPAGTTIRCMGKIPHRNTMRAFRISVVNQVELRHYERIRHVCQHAIHGSFI